MLERWRPLLVMLMVLVLCGLHSSCSSTLETLAKIEK
jgi:hypothetical protein